jgi:hypothetical protein
MRHFARVTMPITTVILAMMTIAASSLPADALDVPNRDVIEVTGFQRLGLNGNSRPITVLVSGPKARVLRRALEGAQASTTTEVCMEDFDPFVISVLLRRGAAPSMVLRAYSCGRPGLSVEVGRSLTANLKDDCAIQSAVVAALPRGQARGTRMAVAQACSFASS